MLKEIINQLNKDIDSLKIFSELFGVCDIITEKNSDNDVSFPAEFCGKGQYSEVSINDLIRGSVYHRVRDNITREEQEEDSITGCENIIEQTYPMLLVGSIKRDFFKTDDAYTAINLAQKIADTLTNESIDGLSLKLQMIETNVESISVDRTAILADEYPNNEDMEEIDYNFILFKIEYNIKVSGEISCFTNCDNL